MIRRKEKNGLRKRVVAIKMQCRLRQRAYENGPGIEEEPALQARTEAHSLDFRE